MKFCPSCGKQLNDEVRFCNSCGAPQQNEPSPQNQPFPLNNSQHGFASFSYNTAAFAMQLVSIGILIAFIFITYFLGTEVAENEVRSQGFYYDRKSMDYYENIITAICVMMALAVVIVIITTIAIARNKLTLTDTGISGESYVYMWNKKFDIPYNDIISVKHRATRLIIKTNQGTCRCYINNINQAKTMIETRIGNGIY